ncbi:MAG: hypothetical protein GXO83_13780 [Chlorobi bacterium]|nr:hypothetical protein [Chlorobiota bacterium]
MCDTFVALPAHTADNSVIFGKNSDREANEAQSLEFHQARTGIKEKTIQCTYISVPQVKETFATLISRPFWMWGAEMGANEKSVVIGNEAVFSWIKPEKTGVLTGMDLIRLALERAPTAENALEIIIALIHDHGQGGIGGYEDKNMAYNNSFLIADNREAWILEVVGHLWAAKKVNGYYAISNGLTIGQEFDRSHPELIEFARKKGKLKKGETFNFARCYSDWFYTTFSACRKRQNRSSVLLHNQSGSYTLRDAFNHLRDHGTEDYRPDNHFLGNRICAHAANSLSRNAMQTTGSFIAHLTKEANTFWATGTAAPCLSLFKPMRFVDKVIPAIVGTPGPGYDPDTLWWHHERLHRTVLYDFHTRSEPFLTERDKTEQKWKELSEKVKDANFYRELTEPAFNEESDLTDKWYNAINKLPVNRKPYGYYRKYRRKLNRKAGMIF